MYKDPKFVYIFYPKLLTGLPASLLSLLKDNRKVTHYITMFTKTILKSKFLKLCNILMFHIFKNVGKLKTSTIRKGQISNFYYPDFNPKVKDYYYEISQFLYKYTIRGNVEYNYNIRCAKVYKNKNNSVRRTSFYDIVDYRGTYK